MFVQCAIAHCATENRTFSRSHSVRNFDCRSRTACGGGFASPTIFALVNHYSILSDMAPIHQNQGYIAQLRGVGAKISQIPAHTTDVLQPLDVGFFRQLKIFAKRVHTQAQYSRRSLRTREELINLHSLLYNQFQAPAYRDMLRYSWHSTGERNDFNLNELECPITVRGETRPRVLRHINFNLERGHSCDVPGCRAKAFLKCAHCGKHLCFDHFIRRTCFHGPGQSLNPLIGGLDCHNQDAENEAEMEEELEMEDDLQEAVFYFYHTVDWPLDHDKQP